MLHAKFSQPESASKSRRMIRPGRVVCLQNQKQALHSAPLRNGARRGAQSVCTSFTSFGLGRKHRERVPKCAPALTSSHRAARSAEHRVTGALVQTGKRGASIPRWTTCMPPLPAARQTSGWPQSGQQWTRVGCDLPHTFLWLSSFPSCGLGFLVGVAWSAPGTPVPSSHYKSAHD